MIDEIQRLLAADLAEGDETGSHLHEATDRALALAAAGAPQLGAVALIADVLPELWLRGELGVDGLRSISTQPPRWWRSRADQFRLRLADRFYGGPALLHLAPELAVEMALGLLPVISLVRQASLWEVDSAGRAVCSAYSGNYPTKRARELARGALLGGGLAGGAGLLLPLRSHAGAAGGRDRDPSRAGSSRSERGRPARGRAVDRSGARAGLAPRSAGRCRALGDRGVGAPAHPAGIRPPRRAAPERGRHRRGPRDTTPALAIAARGSSPARRPAQQHRRPGARWRDRRRAPRHLAFARVTRRAETPLRRGAGGGGRGVPAPLRHPALSRARGQLRRPDGLAANRDLAHRPGIADQRPRPLGSIRGQGHGGRERRPARGRDRRDGRGFEGRRRSSTRRGAVASAW